MTHANEHFGSNLTIRVADCSPVLLPVLQLTFLTAVQCSATPGACFVHNANLRTLVAVITSGVSENGSVYFGHVGGYR